MKKIIISAVSLVLFGLVYYFFDGDFTDYRMSLVTLLELVFLGCAIGVFLPKSERKTWEKREKSFSKGTVLGIFVCVLLMPATLLYGVYGLSDRRYYVMSLLLICEIILPFFLAFEGRKIKTGELVLISVLCSLAVLGRCAFYMLPQFKPTLAVVIVAGAVFGGETGFLVGAVSAFLSNIYFGQGPWTPWQMLACGMVGFFAGIIFKNLGAKKSRLALSVYGGVATVLIYGGILNPASVIMYEPQVTWQAVGTFCLSGLPFDLVHAQSTVFFLWLIAEPMIKRLERIRTKYGFI